MIQRRGKLRRKPPEFEWGGGLLMLGDTELQVWGSWEARGKPGTVLGYPAKENRSEGKGGLPSVRAKGSAISKLIFDSPLLPRAELT